jgi:hypothetical protein
MKMCPISGDEALQSTKKHPACTNGVRINDSNFLTSQISMIPKNHKVTFVTSQMSPNER